MKVHQSQHFSELSVVLSFCVRFLSFSLSFLLEGLRCRHKHLLLLDAILPHLDWVQTEPFSQLSDVFGANFNSLGSLLSMALMGNMVELDCFSLP